MSERLESRRQEFLKRLKYSMDEGRWLKSVEMLESGEFEKQRQRFCGALESGDIERQLEPFRRIMSEVFQGELQLGTKHALRSRGEHGEGKV